MRNCSIRAKAALVALLLTALVACAAPPLLQANPGLEAVLSRYYAEHATEKNGLCRHPRLQVITRIEAIEQSDSRLVVNIRYRFADPIYRNGVPLCWNFASRVFELERGDGGLRVIRMEGKRAPQGD